MEDIKNILMELDFNALMQLLTLYGLRVLYAVLIFFVGKWVAGKVSRLICSMMKRARVDETLISFAKHVIYAALLVFVVIAALSQLGIETTSLAAALAAAGLAVGLALQGSLSNLAAGVMIILFRPFRVGDYVEAGGTGGTVEDISIFTTSFKTPDNKHVIVPNNEITAKIITNYSAKSERRLDMVIGVSYNDDLLKVKNILTKILEEEPLVLKEPKAVVAVLALADSSVNFAVRPWVKTVDYWDAHFALHEKIKTTLDAEGISIPFPQREIHVYEHSSAENSNKFDGNSKKKIIGGNYA